MAAGYIVTQRVLSKIFVRKAKFDQEMPDESLTIPGLGKLRFYHNCGTHA